MSKKSAISNAEWLDSDEYPFQSKYLTLEQGNLHYIDEGDGPVILFVHGTPAWSFVYRKQIKALSNNFRCIAVDHLGFGLSDAPKDFSYTPLAHSGVLTQFISKLGLQNINLVVHDFGGPIGLSCAVKQPELFHSLTILNTWAWPFDNDPQVIKISKSLSGGMGKFLYQRLNFSAKYLLPKGFANKSLLSKEVHQHYLKPFNSASRRVGTWVFARELDGSSDFYAQLERQLDNLANIKTTIVWGMKDELIKALHLQKWREITQNFSNITFHEISHAGHFLQEDAAKQVTMYISQTAY